MANSSSLSSILATVTSPWLTKGKSKGLVEMRSRSVKQKDPFSILCTTDSEFFSNVIDLEDENDNQRTYP